MNAIGYIVASFTLAGVASLAIIEVFGPGLSSFGRRKSAAAREPLHGGADKAPEVTK